jgi:cytochrome c-type biogenesis protein CcmE
MTPARKRRLYWVLGILAGVGIAGALALSAFQKNVMFFFDPTQVAAGEVKQGERFRLGGMVSKGSFHRQPGSLDVTFVVTDFKTEQAVKYTGVLPDLFREGQGVVAHGKLNPEGVFVADEVLAKHDEKYMPPEVAKSLKKNEAAYAPGGETGNSATTPEVPAKSPAGI